MQVQEGISVSCLIRIPEGPSKYARRLSIAAWLNENPWIDMVESGKIEFNFRRGNLTRILQLWDTPEKVERYT